MERGIYCSRPRRRRPLFMVWGYAPTREAVSVIFTLSFTHLNVKGRARKRSGANGMTVASACHFDLHRKSNAEHLVAYITTHHESLLALLPHRYKGTGRVMLPGRARSRQTGIFVISRPLLTIYGRRPGPGTLWRAATRPSTVYGGMPQGFSVTQSNPDTYSEDRAGDGSPGGCARAYLQSTSPKFSRLRRAKKPARCVARGAT